MAIGGRQVPEIWKPCLNGCYEISSLGRVRRLKATQGARVGRLVSLRIYPDTGYPYVHLSIGSKQQCRTIHTLIAKAFLGPCPKGCEVHHKDRVRSNSVLQNLEYLPYKQNRARGEEKIKIAKLTEGDVRAIRALYKPIHGSARALTNMFQVSRSAILAVVSRRTWAHVK